MKKLRHRIIRIFGKLISSVPIFFLVVSVGAFDKVTVHYNRPDGDYAQWSLWSWGIHTGKSEALNAEGKDDFGVYFVVDMKNYGGAEDLGFLPRYKNWEMKDDPDRLYNVKMGENVYMLTEDKNVYSEKPDVSPRVVKVLMDSKRKFRIVVSKGLTVLDFPAQKIIFKDSAGKKHNVVKVSGSKNKDGKIKVLEAELQRDIPVKKCLGGSVALPGYRRGRVFAGKILDEAYFSSNLEMGALYSPTGTTFRLFAPTAEKVFVRIYNNPEGGRPSLKEMSSAVGGVWEFNVGGDLIGKFYKFKTVFFDGECEAMDPYSKCNTATRGRCIITNDRTPIAKGPSFSPTEAVIYEVHIRDISIDKASGVKNRGKYIGLAEYPTHLDGNENITTALAHIKELGINVVQLMPFQDFDNNEENDEYNWGYMPFHFNSPEGGFATKRNDATRVREVKEMISAFHRQGIKVVMDVVYNHTAESNSEVKVSFNAAAADYYYRLASDGAYLNGSGCGNEFRSESPMGRKYILDSLKYWVKEYDVDGFRFDLMGLIDLETMKVVVSELRKLKKDILIYGEPWTASAASEAFISKGLQKGLGFGCFNDNMRDALRGSEWDDKAKGYIYSGNDRERIKKGILGSITDFTSSPDETINYFSVHDGYTAWDKIAEAAKDDPTVTEKDRIEMMKLAAAILLTSQGIPFLYAGQDFLRTKNGVSNSYNSPDSVNMIDWKRKEKYIDVFNYHKGLIALRKAHPMFRFKIADEIRENIYFLDDAGYELPGKCIAYIINKGKTGDKWENCLVAFNPDVSAASFKIPSSKWKEALDKDKFYPAGSGSFTDSVEVSPRSARILYNSDKSFAERVLKEIKLKKPHIEKKKFQVSAPGASKVTIAGTFNGWNKESHPLAKGENDLWFTELELPSGVYEYKFLQDGDWDILNKHNRVIEVKHK